MPTSEPGPIQWIQLNDFSPGIFSDWYSLNGSQPAPDGAAQMSGTYGCVASPSGGLIPGPRLVRTETEDDLDTLANMPSSEQQFNILGFRLASSINIGPDSSTLTFRPNGDKVASNFKNQAGATTNLYQSLDEVIFDSTDYITPNNISIPTHAASYACNFGTAAFSLGSSSITAIKFYIDASVPFNNATIGNETFFSSINDSGSSTSHNADTYEVFSAYTTVLTYDENPFTSAAWTEADIQEFDADYSLALNDILTPPPGAPDIGFLLSTFQIWRVRMQIVLASTATGLDPDQAFYGYQWYVSTDAGVSYKNKSLVRTYKFWDDPVSTYTPTTITTTATIAPAGPFPYGYISFDMSRSNTSAPTSVGYPVMGYQVNPHNETASAVSKAYPSNATPSTDSIADLNFTNKKLQRLFSHQDRFFGVVDADVESFGTDGNIGHEVLRALNTNNYGTDSGTNTTFVNENPSNVGAVHSSNASELLVIKVRGGGYVMRGDVLNPTIVRLPGIVPANILHIPVPTPLGLVYAGSSGVFLWTGGNSSQCISPQLETDFWIPDGTEDFLGPIGSFSYAYPFIFAPNAFMMDTRTNAWWRLKNTIDYSYAWSEVSSTGQVLFAPPFFIDGIPICDWYNLYLGTDEYQWTSQPLQKTISRLLQFREIDIVLQGIGTVTVTITGITGESATHTFEIDSPDVPIALREETSVIGQDVVVTIHSIYDGNGMGDNPAPRVYRLALAYHEDVALANE